MIYLFDLALPMPTKDLYDTSVMLMAVAAAKDMYERGEKRIDDFYDKYGDFYSPIASDVDYVHNETIGKLKNALDYMLANGIDPLRSSEGRAMVLLAIRSVNTTAIANKKRSAKAAEDYIKSREAAIKSGTWNPEYERAMLGGLLLEEWDGSLGDWTATSASPYKDLNNRYHHLFDNMTLSYDEEASKRMPGWIVKSKSKKDMRTILEANLVDLKSDPQYQYDHERIKKTLMQSNPFMSESDANNKADEILKNEIIDRNHESSGTQIERDPVYQQEMQFRQQERMARLNNQLAKDLEDYKTQKEIEVLEKKDELGIGNGSGNGSKTVKGKNNHMLNRMRVGLERYTSAFGQNGTMNRSIVKASTEASKIFKDPNLSWEDKKKTILNKLVIKDSYLPDKVEVGLGRKGNDIAKNRVHTIYMDENDVNKLYSDDEIVSTMLGARGKKHNTDRSKLEGKSLDLQMEITPETITIPGRDNRAHQYIKVRIYGASGGKIDTMWYELQRSTTLATESSFIDDKTGLRVTAYNLDSPYDYSWDESESGYYSSISDNIENTFHKDENRVDDSIENLK